MVGSRQAKDLLKRLETVRPNQALPREYELAILAVDLLKIAEDLCLSGVFGV